MAGKALELGVPALATILIGKGGLLLVGAAVLAFRPVQWCGSLLHPLPDDQAWPSPAACVSERAQLGVWAVGFTILAIACAVTAVLLIARRPRYELARLTAQYEAGEITLTEYHERRDRASPGPPKGPRKEPPLFP